MLKTFFKSKHYLFVTILFIFQINYCEFKTNTDQRFYNNVTAMSFFRFHDFVPRNALKTDLDRMVENKRRPRGFQFHADNRDFNIELEFIVPFIRIPIGRSMAVTKTAFRNLINLNFQSLLTTGAIVAIGGIFAIILKTVFTQYLYISDYRKSLRIDDVYQPDSVLFTEFYNKNNSDYISNIGKFATIMESKLQDNNINISDCIQSYLCRYAQQNFFNTTNANSKSLPRILDGVFSLASVRNYLNGTALRNTLDVAKNGDACYKVYNNCNWSFSSQTKNFLTEIFNYINIT